MSTVSVDGEREAWFRPSIAASAPSEIFDALTEAHRRKFVHELRAAAIAVSEVHEPRETVERTVALLRNILAWQTSVAVARSSGNLSEDLQAAVLRRGLHGS
jgi:DNA-directed RNA polymerase specialized sigma24 family protein